MFLQCPFFVKLLSFVTRLYRIVLVVLIYFCWDYDIEPSATNAIDNIAKVPYKPPYKAFNADFCLAPLLNPFK